MPKAADSSRSCGKFTGCSLMVRVLGVQTERHGPYEGVQRILYGVSAGEMKRPLTPCQTPGDGLQDKLLAAPQSTDDPDPEAGGQDTTTGHLKLSPCSCIMFAFHLCTAVVLGGLGTYRAWDFEGRAPFSPYHNLTAAEIEQAALAGDPYTTDEILSIQSNPWSLTYLRLSAYLVFLMLSVLLHYLVLSVSRSDPIAIAIRVAERVASQSGAANATARPTQSLWTTAYSKDRAETKAKSLCVRLWVPMIVGVVMVIWIGDTHEMGGRVLSAVCSDFFPLLTIAAATLLLGTMAVTVEKHVEDLLEPYVGSGGGGGGDLGHLLNKFCELATELDNTDLIRGWRWVLGTEILLTCALVANATTSLLGSHGYQISLLTGDPLYKSMTLMYLVQTAPVLWSLWLSFDTVICLNTYLGEIPARISRSCAVPGHNMAQRDHFASEYARLGVHVRLPFVGEMTTTTRYRALLSFAGMLSLAMTFPGQVSQALQLNQHK